MISSAPITFGMRLDGPPPLRGVPPDALKVRVRMRMNEESFVYVRTKDGIRKYCVVDEDGCWRLLFPVAENLTVR